MTDWMRRFESVAVEWRPDEQISVDTVDARRPAEFAALLDQPSPVRGAGDALPPLWHWFLHLPVVPRANLGTDGHPRGIDAMLPPLPDERRRMFGGGRVEVKAPLVLGERVRRTSTVVDARAARGRSGPLLVTTLRHVLDVDDEPRLTEEQQVVYLPPRPTGTPAPGPIGRGQPAPAGKDVIASLSWSTDPVALFRFSAMTANAHRIHYDADYAREVEGHAGLLVHGPLSALLLAEVTRRCMPDQRLSTFRWTARSPVYVGQSLRVDATTGGDGTDLELHAAGTRAAVVATAAFALADTAK